MQEPYTPVGYLAARIPLIELLKLKHPDNEKPEDACDVCEGDDIKKKWTAWDVCEGKKKLQYLLISYYYAEKYHFSSLG